jgi:hypothetical protein
LRNTRFAICHVAIEPPAVKRSCGSVAELPALQSATANVWLGLTVSQTLKEAETPASPDASVGRRFLRDPSETARERIRLLRLLPSWDEDFYVIRRNGQGADTPAADHTLFDTLSPGVSVELLDTPGPQPSFSVTFCAPLPTCAQLGRTHQARKRRHKNRDAVP